jgi:hypothetical protein
LPDVREDIQRRFWRQVSAVPQTVGRAEEIVDATSGVKWLRLIPVVPGRCPVEIEFDERYCDLVVGTVAIPDDGGTARSEAARQAVEDILQAVVHDGVCETVWTGIGGHTVRSAVTRGVVGGQEVLASDIRLIPWVFSWLGGKVRLRRVAYDPYVASGRALENH